MGDKSIFAYVAGHACVDIRLPFELAIEVVRLIEPEFTYKGGSGLKPVDLTPEQVEKISHYIGSALAEKTAGGSVPNTGIPLSYLSMDLELSQVKLMAKVGDDQLADTLESIINKYAPCSAVLKRVKSETTSFTIIITDPETGESTYVHNSGANNTFNPDDVDMSLVEKAVWFHFGYPQLMRGFYGNRDTLAELFRRVKNKNTKTSLDMHGMEEGKPAGNADWAYILGNTLPNTDILGPNIKEALYLYFKINNKLAILKQYEDEAIKQGKDIIDIIEPDMLYKSAKLFLDMGAKIVMIKLGHAGLYLQSGKNKETMWNNREILVPAHDVIVKDTTAAGDNTSASLIAAVGRKWHPLYAAGAANSAGGLAVQYVGSIGAFGSWEDIIKFMETTPYKKLNKNFAKGDYFKPVSGGYLGRNDFKT